MVWTLDRYQEHFSHCAALLQFSRASKLALDADTKTWPAPWTPDHFRYGAWSLAAAHSAVLSLYNFGTVLETVLAVRKNPNLKAFGSYFEKNTIQVIRRQFAADFPKYELIRHAVGHSAEFLMDTNKHAIRSEDAAPMMVADSLNGTKYGHSVEGEFVEVDISEESSQKLRAIVDRIAESFNPVRAALSALPDGSLLQPKAQP
jgi:hypothetical protein